MFSQQYFVSFVLHYTRKAPFTQFWLTVVQVRAVVSSVMKGAVLENLVKTTEDINYSFISPAILPVPIISLSFFFRHGRNRSEEATMLLLAIAVGSCLPLFYADRFKSYCSVSHLHETQEKLRVEAVALTKGETTKIVIVRGSK